MKDYSVKIIDSSREFKGKDAIIIKDVSNADPLNKLSADGEFIFKPVDFAVLEIHNERSENKDYTVYVLVGDDGSMYSTSSDNFFDTFIDIFEELQELDEEWALKVFQKNSKKREGQKFMTCAVC